ncbi:uncharacterized protein N7482_005468 [Penicillium canariense]|uniref:Uncharacterized protein n=1 Tax=Penicillium canariense TaxID=189055 RepID=A0A9W9I6N5_9EURO|nr:uncharacterized protein N7482_005468 [Penicillium canariense]KAJ5166687.1 hypothetical protein N7482_005468 [Penicillium canariense]
MPLQPRMLERKFSRERRKHEKRLDPEENEIPDLPSDEKGQSKWIREYSQNARKVMKRRREEDVNKKAVVNNGVRKTKR